MRNAPNSPHRPTHLREVCALLALGLVRLQRHTSDDLARDAAQLGDEEESSLHFVGHQSRHANPRDREHE
jgi:hypothetical protein